MKYLKLSNKHIKNKTGQAIVEFAIVFPFFLLIIIGGIIDFGISINNYIILQNIVNNTAEWGAKNNKNQKEIEIFLKKQKPISWQNDLQINQIKNLKLKTSGTALKVSVSYINPTITPFYQIITNKILKSNGIKITSEAFFKIPEKIHNE